MRSWSEIRSGRWMLICGATLALAQLSWAGPALVPVNRTGGPQIMLFVSQPLGGVASRRFGLRLENQSTSREASGLAGPLRHQPLLGLQFNAEDHLQLQIGRNVAIGHDASGWHSTRAAHAPLPLPLIKH